MKKMIENISTLHKGMVEIPAGEFLMGASGWGEFESPIHKVFIDAFLMDEALVTNSQFLEFVKKTNYKTTIEEIGSAWGYRNGKYQDVLGLNWKTYFTQNRSNHPVVLVSWRDATSYASWVGKRLPSEAEWEKAARGGNQSQHYPWGNEKPDGTQCNFANKPHETPPTTSVRQFPTNSYGLYDMVGNVWQWCADWYLDDYYKNSPSSNPQGPDTGEHKVRRGGSWNVIQPFRLRNSNRGAMDPHSAVSNIGFRCAKSIDTY